MYKNILISIIVGLIFYSINVKALSNIDTTLTSSVNDKNVIVTLNVKKANEGIDALTGKIEYDASKLEFVEVKSANNKLKEPLYNENNGKFTILIKSDSVITPSDIVTFKFKIKNNIKGSTEIKIKQITAATSSDKKINLNDNSTIINISNTIVGNNDSKNNKTDGENDNTSNKIDKPNNEDKVKTDKENSDNKQTNDKIDNKKEPSELLEDSKKEYNKCIYVIVAISIILIITICKVKKHNDN
jgi:hypothetical protein